MHRMKTGAIGLAALLVSFGLLQAAAVKKNIQVSLHRNRIQNMTASGLLLEFVVKISNASSSRYFLKKYDYRAVIGQTEYLRLATDLDEPIAVEPKGETLVALPLKITYGLLFQTIPDVEQKSRIGCALTGMMVFADEKKREERTPFAFQGEFPIFKDPEVRISAVRVKEISVGGADVVLGFSLINLNDFDLEAGVVRYKLELGGRTLLEGSVLGPLILAPAAEKVFPYPLLLDFFEIGNQLFALLQKTEIEGVLIGEVEAETAWGSVTIPILKKAKVPVLKSSKSER